MNLKALSTYLSYRFKREQRENYVADMLWALATERRFNNDLARFGELTQPRGNPKTDNRTGKEIKQDIQKKIVKLLGGGTT